MRTSAGFSIMELMIALTLGLLVAIAASSVFVQGKRSYEQNEQLSRTQENGRFAMKLIQRDLSMSGFFAEMNALGGVGVNALGADSQGPESSHINITPCGAASTIVPVQNTLIVVDGQTPGAVAAAFPCITDHLPGTDAVAIKRVADNPNCTVTGGSGPCATANNIYLLTNGAIAWFHVGELDDGAAPDSVELQSPRSDWRYYVHIYYIRSWSVTPGDGIPTLCREALNVSGGDHDDLRAEPLADGIEDLQIQLGVDTDANRIPDFYTATPTAAQTSQAETAKFYLLARSPGRVPGITNDVTYSVGGIARGPFNDGFLRRVYSSSAQLRN